LKKISILIAILFIAMPLYAQETLNVNVKKEKSFGEQQNEAATARAATAAAMSDAKRTTIVPLSVDFNDYTHIAIVDVLNSAGRRGKSGFNNVFKALISSPLTILNPTSDKNKFKENSFYLRNTKNPKWLYLYYTASRIGVDLTVSIILRNLENEIVYSASSINIPFREVLNQVANGSLTLNENLGIIKEKNTNFDGVEKEVIGRDEAIKRIKEAKDLFDTGILSQEEYDKLVAKYKVIIMAN
tara:strand:- start:29 stop:757 length:729 start_codon:yes stop_codon:yes gene_type:complete